MNLSRTKLLVTSIVLTIVGGGVLLTNYYKLGKSSFPRYRFSINESYNDTNQIIKELEKRISDSPNDALNRAALASLQISKARITGDFSGYQKAEVNAKESLKLLPRYNPQALLVLARIAEAHHDFDRAISLAKKGMGIKTKTEALSVLVTSYLAKGDLEKASFSADQLIQKSPGVATYPLRALVLYAQGREEEAEYDFRRALAVEDIDEQLQSAWARALFARFHLKKGRIFLAEQLLKESLRIHPKYPLALDLQGELELQKKQYNKAADNFFEAFILSRQPPYLRRYAQAKQLAGEIDTSQNARKEAEKNIRKQLTEGDYGHRTELALLLLEKGSTQDVQESLSLMQDEMKIRKTAQGYQILARGFMMAKQWTEAQIAIQAALSSGVRDTEIYLDAARIERELGNIQKTEFFQRLSKG